MKKALIIALMLLASVSAFAAVPGEFNDENNTAVTMNAVPVTFNLAKGTTYYIGFTNDVTNVAAGKDASGINDAESIELKLDATQTYGELGTDNNLYVYWVVSGNQKLKIELKAEGTLDNTEHDKHLNWQVQWNKFTDDTSGVQQTLGSTDIHGEDGENVEETAYTTALPVYERSNIDGVVDRGYTQLSIKTQDVTKAAPEAYESSLQLIVTPIN